jgi:HSF-type DNA-binding
MVPQLVTPSSPFVYEIQLFNQKDQQNNIMMYQSSMPLTMSHKMPSSEHPSISSTRPRARFPMKLRAVLNDAALEGNEHIISWLPHGKAFKVHKPDLFASMLMRRYFRQSHFRSFTRQVRILISGRALKLKRR